MATDYIDFDMLTFDQIKDEFIGETGTQKRTQYEQELQIEVLREMNKIKKIERKIIEEKNK